MAQKTAKQIQDEANRLFGKGASDKKFEWRRQQQAEAGLEQEKKTRGGVAGAYDRNKKIVQAAIPLIAGALIPGSSLVAGAISGGLARGLDREGKGGIGLDLGQAAKGAVTGAALGGLGGAARTGIQGMMAGGTPLKAMPAPGAGTTVVGGQAPGAVTAMPGAGAGSALKAMPEMGRGITSLGQQAASVVGAPGASAGLTQAAVPMMNRLGSMAGQAGSYLAKRPEIAAAALTNYSQSRQAAANRALQEKQMAQQESQFQRTFGQSEEERKREIERQQRIAQMLAPLFQRIAGGQG